MWGRTPNFAAHVSTFRHATVSFLI